MNGPLTPTLSPDGGEGEDIVTSRGRVSFHEPQAVERQTNRLTPHPGPLPVEGRGRRSGIVGSWSQCAQEGWVLKGFWGGRSGGSGAGHRAEATVLIQTPGRDGRSGRRGRSALAEFEKASGV